MSKPATDGGEQTFHGLQCLVEALVTIGFLSFGFCLSQLDLIKGHSKYPNKVDAARQT